ncbi:sugar kinase [Nocardioides humilatus]|uniref:Sugar kinase n=1 Tax=Nocardioides humilatus TaxID=2607660 RepID=A0A5B1LMQ4_9ACTN|nr:sugar kinase [Nocardioides humilatus]KAA1421794.1 sugar kinase [Nocardioides humilatus]
MTLVVQCIGECMIEFVRTGAGAGAQVQYAGDTFNTAVYLRRASDALGVEVDVRFLSGVGVDDESDRMRAYWRGEGVADDVVLVDGRHPGAYLVTTHDDGERSFLYWRRRSAAAHVFAGTDWLEAVRGDLVYLSGITTQLLGDAALDGVVARLAALRDQGARVVFDSNYRPAAWESPARAAEAMARVLAVSDIALVTLEDEIALGRAVDVASAVAALTALGVGEVVVKVGTEGAWVTKDGGPLHVATVAVDAVDTTAAGDSFNGGYLAGRLAGLSPSAAAQVGNRIAGAVVQSRGAVVDVALMPVLS